MQIGCLLTYFRFERIKFLASGPGLENFEMHPLRGAFFVWGGQRERVSVDDFIRR